MPLTRRTNGSGSSNLIQASWWNDYLDLFSGVMTDQPITQANSITMKGAAPPSAPSGFTFASGGSLSAGAYLYAVAFVDSNGVVGASSATAGGTASSGQKCTIGTIPTGPSGTSARWILRTKAGSPDLYFLAKLNDNTTTTYVDSAADTALTNPALADGGIGAIQFQDSTSTVQGYISGASGRLGIGCTTSTYFQQGNLEIAHIDSTGITLRRGSINMNLSNGTTPSVIQVGAGLGVKKADGTKIGEFKGNGNFIISGGQFQSSGGSVSTASGQSFDSFDVAESYECAEAYPPGTVVCPGPQNTMVRCSHENCHAACVISASPGLYLSAGEDAGETVLPVALAGRVNIRTAHDIPPRMLVVSDGRGGVRPITPGQPSFVIGIALNDATDGQVGVLLRPMFCVVK